MLIANKAGTPRMATALRLDRFGSRAAFGRTLGGKTRLNHGARFRLRMRVRPQRCRIGIEQFRLAIGDGDRAVVLRVTRARAAIAL